MLQITDISKGKLTKEKTKIGKYQSFMFLTDIKIINKNLGNALLRQGFRNLNDLSYKTIDTILKIPRIGKDYTRQLSELADAVGIKIGSNANNVPDFTGGDKVIYLTSGNKDIESGQIFYVIRKQDQSWLHSYRIPLYEAVKDGDSSRKRYLLSVGEIEKA